MQANQTHELNATLRCTIFSIPHSTRLDMPPPLGVAVHRVTLKITEKLHYDG